MSCDSGCRCKQWRGFLPWPVPKISYAGYSNVEWLLYAAIRELEHCDLAAETRWKITEKIEQLRYSIERCVFDDAEFD